MQLVAPDGREKLSRSWANPDCPDHGLRDGLNTWNHPLIRYGPMDRYAREITEIRHCSDPALGEWTRAIHRRETPAEVQRRLYQEALDAA